MAEKEKGKYQRCDECHGSYLIVFECKDKKKRCARCKERFDGKEIREALKRLKDEHLRRMRQLAGYSPPPC